MYLREGIINQEEFLNAGIKKDITSPISSSWLEPNLVAWPPLLTPVSVCFF